MNSPFPRHYQGESKPFAAAVSYHADDQIHLPNIKMTWSELSRFNYSIKLSSPDAPLSEYDIANVGELSLEHNYTMIPAEVCLVGFWVLLAVEVVLIMLGKKIANPLQFKRQTWLEILTNCSESSQIPMVFEDWDDVHGPIESYKKAQRKVEHEIGWTLVVNQIMNLLKCVPMIILGKILFLQVLNKELSKIPKLWNICSTCLYSKLAEKPHFFSDQCTQPTNGFGEIHRSHARRNLCLLPHSSSCLWIPLGIDLDLHRTVPPISLVQ